MKKVTASCVLLGVTALALNSLTGAQTSRAVAFAAPESVNIVLHDNQLQYVVPMDKTLVIENFIWALESDSTHQTISLDPANDPVGVGSFQLKFNTTQPDMFTPETPIRIKGDGTAGIRILKNSQVDWRDVLITGQLIGT